MSTISVGLDDLIPAFIMFLMISGWLPKTDAWRMVSLLSVTMSILAPSDSNKSTISERKTQSHNDHMIAEICVRKAGMHQLRTGNAVAA